jgi:hypothetical protein
MSRDNVEIVRLGFETHNRRGVRAVALMPAARIEVVPGNHAPFLDDPERCAALIRQMT